MTDFATTMNYIILLMQAISDSITRFLVQQKLTVERHQREQQQQQRQQPGSLSWRLIIFNLNICLAAYKAWKKILNLILGVSTLDRLCRIGFLEDVRSRKNDCATELAFRRSMTRRAVWLIDCELILSTELAGQVGSMRHYGITAANSNEKNGPNNERMQEAQKIAKSICVCKRITISGGVNFAYSFLTRAVEQIMLMDKVFADVAAECRTAVPLMTTAATDTVTNHSNGLTDEILVEIWNSMHEHAAWRAATMAHGKKDSRGRGGRNWITLGFQGLDPASDFRGTGMFGLNVLHAFAAWHASRAVTVVLESGSAAADDDADAVLRPWYAAALAVIHVASFVARACSEGQLRLWMLSCMTPTTAAKDEDKEEAQLWTLLLSLSCFLMSEFHAYWMHAVRQGMVKSVMDFEQCFTRFCKQMICRLQQRPLAWNRSLITISGMTSLKLHGSSGEYVISNVPQDLQGFANYFQVFDDITGRDHQDRKQDKQD
ncbi:ELMO/CED-12 family-domain-containing protein [Lipomyces japonicus]|uniref:ELMO/CED-12 family-domain-containing protein n=1 Tax=Lipomyces japonicus TaxID=56871 RepID=UPI0034CD9EC2